MKPFLWVVSHCKHQHQFHLLALGKQNSHVVAIKDCFNILLSALATVIGIKGDFVLFIFYLKGLEHEVKIRVMSVMKSQTVQYWARQDRQNQRRGTEMIWVLPGGADVVGGEDLGLYEAVSQERAGSPRRWSGLPGWLWVLLLQQPEWCQASPVCGANVPTVLPGREAGPVPGKLTSSTWIFFASNPNSEKTDWILENWIPLEGYFALQVAFGRKHRLWG